MRCARITAVTTDKAVTDFARHGKLICSGKFQHIDDTELVVTAALHPMHQSVLYGLA
jgi:hypothetical protein